MGDVWIIYATRSRIIRRVIIPDPGMRSADHVGPGESVLEVTGEARTKRLMTNDGRPAFERIGDEIQQRTGLRPISSRCAVLDKGGNVLSVINADPDLDSLPGVELVLHDDAVPGWALKDAQWVKPPEPEVAESIIDQPVPPQTGG